MAQRVIDGPQSDDRPIHRRTRRDGDKITDGPTDGVIAERMNDARAIFLGDRPAESIISKLFGVGDHYATKQFCAAFALIVLGIADVEEQIVAVELVPLI